MIPQGARFCIYPGKVTDYNCFRIGTIGEVYPDDIQRLLQAMLMVSYTDE